MALTAQEVLSTLQFLEIRGKGVVGLMNPNNNGNAAEIPLTETKDKYARSASGTISTTMDFELIFNRASALTKTPGSGTPVGTVNTNLDATELEQLFHAGTEVTFSQAVGMVDNMGNVVQDAANGNIKTGMVRVTDFNLTSATSDVIRANVSLATTGPIAITPPTRPDATV